MQNKFKLGYEEYIESWRLNIINELIASYFLIYRVFIWIINTSKKSNDVCV